MAFIGSGLRVLFKQKTPFIALSKFAWAAWFAVWGYYGFNLMRNQALFYFDAPYSESHFAWINYASYLPASLLIALPYTCRTAWRWFRQGEGSRWQRYALALNNGVWSVLLGLFFYWGLVAIGV